MRHREPAYWSRERYADLNKAYKQALAEGNYTTQYDAMAAAVNMPSRRFWVSEERLAEVISALERGGDPRVYKNPKREMYLELYDRYLRFREGNQFLTRMEICSEIIYQQAPKFYLKPSWGLKILYQGRGRHGRHHHLRKEGGA